MKNHLNEHWDEDVSFFPIKNDIDNSITVTSDKNPSSEKNINIFNNEELFEKIKKMDSGYLQIIGRPGSGKSTLISKVDEQFSNCDSHLFNVKSEVNRLGSVDFLVPLLKTCSKVVSLGAKYSVIDCINQLSAKLPRKSIIIFEDIHLGNVYTERNISYHFKHRPDILILTTSRYEMKHKSDYSEVSWLLDFDLVDQENNYLLSLLTTE